jgi:hypothetical protein
MLKRYLFPGFMLGLYLYFPFIHPFAYVKIEIPE